MDGRLYLYGPPACGKSTLARKLARFYGRPYADLDDVIVRAAGKSIPEIFASEGETGFRRREREALRSVREPLVALGGGTLLDPENRAYAEETGLVVVLKTDPAEIAKRIAADGAATRPLGDRAAERAAHYASFPHAYGKGDRILLPRLLRGRIAAPPSKSHLHRLLIAEFLAGNRAAALAPSADDCDDIRATKRCLAALARGEPTLDCGESGSTLRFLAPVAAALGARPAFVRRGRLAERPMISYDGLAAGVFELRGDVSSQFVTGLLFALPLLEGDSEIRFTTPLQSRGYVDLTLDVLARYGIRVESGEGFRIRGSQRYVSPGAEALASCEGDWSGAAFWLAANALGSAVTVTGVSAASRQPDRVAPELISRIVAAGARGEACTVDVSGCPDLYPALAVVAAARGGGCVAFTGTERLRLKESDRLAAMEGVAARDGNGRFSVRDEIDAVNDHRIAMAAAVAASACDHPVLLHGADSVAKSYPRFWDEWRMDLTLVTGWPLAKTRSPEIHNAAHAAEGRKAEMVSIPRATIEEALEVARVCGAKGMAVTIPHKIAVMRHLDRIDPTAAAIGAVNTVVFRDGKAFGYNTDADGFAEAVTRFLGRPPAGLSVALLGDGGAARAVRQALETRGATVETVHRRALETHPDLIVNATPVDPIPTYAFTGREAVCDLRYEPAETPLLARARAAGCRVENGFSMLEAQARRQRALFFA